MPVNDATKWYDKAATEPNDGYITPSDAQNAIKQIYLDLATVAQVAALTLRVDGSDASVAALASQVQGLASPGELKPPVADVTQLPATGNADGDIRITLDDGHLHVWVGTAWNDVGPVATDKVPDGGNTGDIIMWDGNVGEWQAVEPLLSQLHDVDGRVVPNDGDILQWDATRQLWVMDAPPAPPATGVSADAGNQARLGSDQLVYVPKPVAATVTTTASADPASLPPGTFPGELRTTVNPAEVWVWDGKKWISQGPSTPANIAAIAAGVSKAQLTAALDAAGLNTQHRDAVQDWRSAPPALTNSDDDKGKLYIAKATATGAWSGKDNHVMQWNGTSWDDLGMPIVGEARFDIAGGKILKWAPLPTGWHDLLAEFLPLTGGTLSGALTIRTPAGAAAARAAVALTVDGVEVRAKNDNVGVGALANKYLTTGDGNLSVGSGALGNAATTNNCTSIGASALNAYTGPGFITAVGQASAGKATTGTKAVVIGNTAANGLTDLGDHGAVVIGYGAAATGNTKLPVGLIAIGENAGNNTPPTADDCIAMGVDAKVVAAKTVQLLAASRTGAKVYAGVDQLVSKAEVKALVAGAADWNAFKTAIAAW